VHVADTLQRTLRDAILVSCAASADRAGSETVPAIRHARPLRNLEVFTAGYSGGSTGDSRIRSDSELVVVLSGAFSWLGERLFELEQEQHRLPELRLIALPMSATALRR
jgi:hypothetical protein